MANRAFGLAAFAATAIGGVALGYLGERRVVHGPSTSGPPAASGTLLTAPASGDEVPVMSPDGTRLMAQVSGPPDGAHLLLIHGMALGQEVWHYQRLALQDRYRVISFDLRGHGASGRGADGDYSAGALADDVVAVLQHVVPPDRRLVAVGHSLGGMSLLAALRHHPQVMQDRVAGIGLISTAGRDVMGSLLQTMTAVGASMVQSAVMQARPARWIRARVEGPRSDRVTDMSFLLTRAFGLSNTASAENVEFVDRLNRRTPAVVLGALAQTLTTIDELDLLQEIQVPVLVLVGDLDRMTPPAQAEKLAGRLTDVELVTVPGAGHTAMIEAPDHVNDAVCRLVERAVAAARGAGDPTGAGR